MTSTLPTVRQIAWISIIPQIILMAILVIVMEILSPQNGFLFGVAIYLGISIILRTTIPKDHSKGMKKIREGNFSDAIPDFVKSYDFFTKHIWIDKYRYITLLSSSRVSYREMALNNIAFSYGQIGNGEKAKEYYEQTLKEFPNSGLATAGLRLLNSMGNKN